MTGHAPTGTPDEAAVTEDAPNGDGAVEPSEQRLVNWLASCVWNRQLGLLADLRKSELTHADFRAHLFTDTDDDREIFGQVARLFAIYHRGAAEPVHGYGSLGDAMGRAQAKPSAQSAGFPLKLNRIVNGSRSIRWRDLEKAICALREQGRSRRPGHS